MRWKIEVKPTAEKQYLNLDAKTRKTIREALRELESTNHPLQHRHVRFLTGKLRGDYRLRIGAWRVLFTPDKERKRIFVYAILPFKEAYRK